MTRAVTAEGTMTWKRLRGNLWMAYPREKLRPPAEYPQAAQRSRREKTNAAQMKARRKRTANVTDSFTGFEGITERYRFQAENAGAAFSGARSSLEREVPRPLTIIAVFFILTRPPLPFFPLHPA